MSTIYNFGGIVNYNDNSKNYHIDANNRDLSSIIKEFDTKEETLSVSSEYDLDTSLFCRITKITDYRLRNINLRYVGVKIVTDFY